MKIEILDSIMGSGKTTSIIKWISNHPDKRYIYISPLLSEVGEGGRVQRESKNVQFVCPVSEGAETKSEHLLQLLEQGCNIACTHSLYRNMTDNHLELIKKVGYIVIIDEELGMIDGFNDYSASDMKWLSERDIVKCDDADGKLSWCEQEFNELITDGHRYNKLKRMCEMDMLYASKRTVSMVTTHLPTRLIDVAERVIVLTYMFKGNVLDCFLRLKGFEITSFTEVDDDLRKVSGDLIRSLITITAPPKKFNLQSKLSSTWYDKASADELKMIENGIRAVARSWGVKCNQLIYTFPKARSITSDSKKMKIRPNGYISYKIRNADGKLVDVTPWLAASIRATNNYAHISHAIHCYRRYPLVSVDSYLKDFGVTIDVKVYALSELLQWLWRTSIRNNNPINVCIMSDYMLELFIDWLNDLE